MEPVGVGGTCGQELGDLSPRVPDMGSRQSAGSKRRAGGAASNHSNYIPILVDWQGHVKLTREPPIGTPPDPKPRPASSWRTYWPNRALLYGLSNAGA